MIRRSFRVGLTLGILGGLIMAFVRAVQSRNSASQPAPPSPSWSPAPQQWAPPRPSPASMPAPQPFTPADPAEGASVPTPEPAPEVPRPAKAAAKKARAAKKAAPARRKWIEATGPTCPETHPIKAKMSSRIFQLPGMFAYDRTRPDRCYATEDAAVADGLRKAKR